MILYKVFHPIFYNYSKHNLPFTTLLAFWKVQQYFLVKKAVFVVAIWMSGMLCMYIVGFLKAHFDFPYFLL